MSEFLSNFNQEFKPIDTFIDPVSKIRVSNPANLIDTDFEYGLQPTKWETVELINNTPAFFSKGGDTTIPDITDMTTNAGTREITVTTAFPHGLDIGIPIRVAGSRSVTADGSYIINATPTPTTFTYLSRDNQPATIAIFDLYTSIITGEFFQGSQISISDAAGITTDGQGPNSTLTVRTKNSHGFGLNTPFYFLNLNSTIAQEFEANNSTFVSFDPTNSAVAQTFDGSNTALQQPINFSNSASSSVSVTPVSNRDAAAGTVTVDIQGEDWSGLKEGDPLYYNFNTSDSSSYFFNNTRGIVFIKDTSQFDLNNDSATFQFSLLPNDTAENIPSDLVGFFQLADQGVTFPGNNVNEDTQISLSVEKEDKFFFDGSNTDSVGDNVDGNTVDVVGFAGTTININGSENLDYYVGAMIKYVTDGNAAGNLTNGNTYFITSFSAGANSGSYSITIAELPNGSDISVDGGTATGTQQFAKIGISVDKNIIHIKDSNFQEFDMLEYDYPESGQFSVDDPLDKSDFYFVTTVYDEHNYELVSTLGTLAPPLVEIEQDAGQSLSTGTPTLFGFEEPVSFAVTSGVLPSGLSLNTSTGEVSGTPTDVLASPGRTVEITVTDSRNLTATQSQVYILDQPPISISPSSQTVNGTEGSPISPTTVSVSGLFEPINWQVISGTLPAGLSLDSSTGVISGSTDTFTSSPETITIQATDKNGAQGTQDITFDIDEVVGGQDEYTSPGTYTFTVPNGISNVSVVVVGGGGGGSASSGNSSFSGAGGGGGALAYRNNISVAPGEQWTIRVGNRGNSGNNSSGNTGGASYFRSPNGATLVQANGGGGATRGSNGGNGGNVSAGSGGSGGRGGDIRNNNGGGGGGGAGGYSGNGGNGGEGNSGSGNAGNGGAGGGGGGQSNGGTQQNSGGGVGLKGEGSSGNGGSSNNGGNGGSGGNSGGSSGGNFGGGGGSREDDTSGAGGVGGNGAVRIIYPGSTREFPNTGTADI